LGRSPRGSLQAGFQAYVRVYTVGLVHSHATHDVPVTYLGPHMTHCQYVCCLISTYQQNQFNLTLCRNLLTVGLYICIIMTIFCQ